jgi:O-antigen/teichoic acid export membrane protein
MWTAAERWTVRLLILVVFVLLARLLKPSQFGLVALASTFSGILMTVAEAGITNYIVQASDLDERRINSAFWTAIIISAVFGAALVASAPALAEVLHQRRLAPLIQVLSLTLLFTGVSSVPTGLLQREMQFGRLAGRQIGGAFVSSFVGIGLALAGAGAWALVAQTVTSLGVATVILWIRCPWRPSRQFSFEYAMDSMRFGWKMLTINLLITLRDQGDNLLIGAILGPVALGYWTISSRILLILVELGVTVVQTVSIPAFARLKHDRARLLRAYSKATTVAAMVMLPMLVTVSVMSPDLVPALFGHKWVRAGDLAELQSLTGVFMMLVNFDGSVYIAIGKLRVELVLVSCIVAFHLAVVIVFARYGLIPIAIAVLGQNAITWLIRLQLLRRVVGIRWGAYKGLLAPIISAAACAGLLLTLRGMLPRPSIFPVCLVSLLGLTVYAVALWFLSELFRENIRPAGRTVQRRLARG